MELPFNIYLSFANQWVYFSLSKAESFSIQIGKSFGLTASLNTGNNGWLAFRLEPDYNEQLIWQFGPFYYTVPETEEQRLEREDAEMEDEWLEQEHNRYTQLSY